MADQNPSVIKAALQRACPSDLDVVFRPMFGGVLAYVEGRPFALFGDIGLALKFPGTSGAALLAVEGARPLRYAPGQPPSKTHVLVPDAMIDDPAKLRPWIVNSVEAVAAAPLKPGRRPRR